MHIPITAHILQGEGRARNSRERPRPDPHVSIPCPDCGPLHNHAFEKAARVRSDALHRELLIDRDKAVTRVLFEDIQAKDVESFSHLETKAAPWGRTVPISVSRARAWGKNPHADPEDIVLIVARIDGYCAGYIGLVPGRLQTPEQNERINWVSTFFVPPGLRNYAVGYLLLRRAIAVGRPLAVVEPASAAERISLAVGFKPLRDSSYFELDLVRDRNWLGLPLRAIRRTLSARSRRVPAGLDAAIAACGRPTAYLALSWLLLTAQRKLGRWQFKRLRQLPHDARPTTAGDVHFVRDRAFLEWMLKYPWVTTDPDGASTEYFFDDYREQSFYRVYEMREQASSESSGWAIVWFNVRKEQRTLHVLDYELRTARASAALPVLALREARRFRANRVCVPDACGPHLQQLGLIGGFFSEKKRRFFLLPQTESVARAVLDDIRARYADGDLGFA